MPRVKGNVQTRARRKKILRLAEGYFGSKHTIFRTAHEQVMRALDYARRDRRQTKRNLRKLWISRINAACRLNGFKYSLLINGLAKAGVEVNRKMLADLAVNDPQGFAFLIETAKKGIAGEIKPEPVVKKAVAVEPKKVEKVVEVKAPKAEKAAEVKAPVAEKTVDLASLNVAQLKEVAQSLGLSGLSAMKKAELVEAITKAQSK